MFEPTVEGGVLRVREPGARWLSTGWNGGLRDADAAYNVSVPDGWTRTDLDAYLAERRDAAGFDDPGPALLTGVSLAHCRGARDASVVAYATAGVSNPAALPTGDALDSPRDGDTLGDADGPRVGTVNVLVGTARALPDSALAELLAVAVEAKTATLLDATGFPGTTSDAVVAGTVPDGDPATFAGSSTPVGAAARACVRDAVSASLDARYADGGIPDAVADAEHGVETTRRAEVFAP